MYAVTTIGDSSHYSLVSLHCTTQCQPAWNRRQPESGHRHSGDHYAFSSTPHVTPCSTASTMREVSTIAMPERNLMQTMGSSMMMLLQVPLCEPQRKPGCILDPLGEVLLYPYGDPEAILELKHLHQTLEVVNLLHIPRKFIGIIRGSFIVPWW